MLDRPGEASEEMLHASVDCVREAIAEEIMDYCFAAFEGEPRLSEGQARWIAGGAVDRVRRACSSGRPLPSSQPGAGEPQGRIVARFENLGALRRISARP